MNIKTIKSFLFVVLGFLSFGIGVAGVVMPVLPGGPFFLFAAFCFARSSKRVENWFKGTSFYTEYVVRIRENRGMTRKEKIRINVIADAFILFSVVYVDILLVKIIMVALCIMKHYYFIKEIPTITQEEAKTIRADLRKRQMTKHTG
ncbi:YbaN family protein [Virgibacillus sp. MSP4-1]|uniref:YbaN family protein n=1 Tax=Virgibacillus sp. MSP4-1 TaxID=2700081 RepID=UPI00039D0FE7|nr:YbaN family protein [Virgibacillus sp. MSP4-1]